jgi:hypothetical protein
MNSVFKVSRTLRCLHVVPQDGQQLKRCISVATIFRSDTVLPHPEIGPLDVAVEWVALLL